MNHLTEQDAGLLEQAASMLEGLANDERNRGNCSSAEGAACSAHAIRRLAPALLRAGRGCLAQIEEPARAAPAAPAGVVADMAALVKQLVQALRKAAPNHVLPAKALDYLRRQGLLCSPLRSAAAIGPQPSAQET